MSPADNPTIFVTLADGSTLLRQGDGSFRPARSSTDLARLQALTEDDIERQSRADPDHPGLDDAFWAGVDAPPVSDDSVRLDPDVRSFFGRESPEREARINAVLRRYVDAQAKR